MNSGDTKTEAMLNVLGNGGSGDQFRGCCNTKTQSYILDAIDRINNLDPGGGTSVQTFDFTDIYRKGRQALEDAGTSEATFTLTEEEFNNVMTALNDGKTAKVLDEYEEGGKDLYIATTGGTADSNWVITLTFETGQNYYEAFEEDGVFSCYIINTGLQSELTPGAGIDITDNIISTSLNCYLSVDPSVRQDGVTVYSDIDCTTPISLRTFFSALRDGRTVWIRYRNGNDELDNVYAYQVVTSLLTNVDTDEAYNEIEPRGYYYNYNGNMRSLGAWDVDPDATTDAFKIN